MTTDPNSIQYFKEISNYIFNQEKSVNIFDYAVEKHISVPEAQFILNSYILQNNDISNLVVIYRAEIIEIDILNNKEKISIKFFPNYLLQVFDKIPQENILDFGVYCILKKYEDFILNDFSLFSHAIQKLENLNIDDFQIVSNNPNVKNNFTQINSKNASKNLTGKSQFDSNLEKNYKKKIVLENQSKIFFNFP